MEASIVARSKETLNRFVTRICVPVVLGLAFFVQPAWSTIVISPSPSYTGNYGVTWGTPLGCYTYYDDFGAQWDVCSWVTESQGSTVTGTWYSGSSASISGKRAGTYTYSTLMHYVSYMWGVDTYQTAEGPTSVQVILPTPDPHFSASPVPLSNHPNYYNVGWTSTNTDPNGCTLDLAWFVSGQGPPVYAEHYPNYPANYSPLVVNKYYSSTVAVQYDLTCVGPGGSTHIGGSLGF